MAQNKKQHYVPQFYLRNFGTEAQVSLFNINTNMHIHGAAITGQCQRPYLYGKDGEIEKALSALEGAVRPILSKLMRFESEMRITAEESKALYRFIAYQHARTPLAGKEVEASATQMMHMIAKTDPAIKDKISKADIESVLLKHKNPVLFALLMMDTVCPEILDMEPKLLVNETMVQFVAADTPVVLHNQWCEGEKNFGVTGVCSAGLQIFFPISPRHCVLLFDRDVYSVGKPNNSIVYVQDPKDIAGINLLQFIHAESNIYYSGDENTGKAISSFPKRLRESRAKLVRSKLAVAEHGDSHLVHQYRQLIDFKLHSNYMKIKKDKRNVGLMKRSRMLRHKPVTVDTSYKDETSSISDFTPAMKSERYRIIDEE